MIEPYSSRYVLGNEGIYYLRIHENVKCKCKIMLYAMIYYITSM